MKAQIVKDCSDIDPRLYIGVIVDSDMQIVYGSNSWERYYRVYMNDDDFYGYLLPINSIDCLDEDYIRMKQKIEKEHRERQLRFVNSWINVVVSVGPRGGVREIMYGTESDRKINTISKGKSRLYLSLLNELGIEYKVINITK